MAKTFSYRRHEVVKETPPIAEFKARWPALFCVVEINAEFLRITTVPLQSSFFAGLDKATDKLMTIFGSKGGVCGRKIKRVLEGLSQNNSIDVQRECILKALCVYFSEDHQELVKEYIDLEEAEKNMGQTLMAVYTVRREGAEATDEPAHVGIVIEGVENVALGCAMFFGLRPLTSAFQTN